MSGLIVPIIGGPLDGREWHRACLGGGPEEIVAVAPGGQVHVWLAASAPDAPFEYYGTRPASRYDGATCVTWGVGPLLDALRWWLRKRNWRLAWGCVRAFPAAIAWSVRHRGWDATWHRPPWMIQSHRVPLDLHHAATTSPEAPAHG